MDINITHVLTSSRQSDNSFESKVRLVLKKKFENEKPVKRTINAILSFAASYEGLDTRIGNVDVILN